MLGNTEPPKIIDQKSQKIAKYIVHHDKALTALI